MDSATYNLEGVNRPYRPTQGNCSGMFYSFKTGRQCPWRGTLERDAMILWDVDPAVSSFVVEPLVIPYAMPTGRKSHYTPDRLVHYADGRPSLLVEIKPSEHLRKKRKLWKCKFAAASNEATSRGWIFQVLTERHLRGVHLDNAVFLRRFLRHPANIELQDRLLAGLQEMQTASGRDLLQGIAKDANDHSLLIPQLWRLIVLGRIQTSWKELVTLDSAMSIGEEGAPDE